MICDLGDVLFTWSPPTTTAVPKAAMRAMMRSATWDEYERGRTTEDQTYRILSEKYGYALKDVEITFAAARATLKPTATMFDLIRRIRNSGVVLYAMSNISKPDWEVLMTKATEEEWALFDRVFIS